MNEMDTRPEERILVLLQQLVRELVDRPDESRVRMMVSDAEGVLVFTVRVAADEVGKVIGKHGRSVNAITTLIKSIAAKHKLRAQVEVADGHRQSVA